MKKQQKQYLMAFHYYLQSIQSIDVRTIKNPEKLKFALKIYLEALQLTDTLKYYKGNIDYNILLKRYFSPLYENGIELAYELHQQEKDSYFIFTALWLIERYRSHLFYESLKNSLIASYLNYDIATAKNFRKLTQKILLFRQKIDSLHLKTTNSNEKKSLYDSLYIAQNHSDSMAYLINVKVQQLIKINFNTYLSSNHFEPFTIKNHECFLVFFYGDKNIFALAFNNTENRFFKIPSDTLLQHNLQKLHKSLFANDFSTFSATSYFFYELLLKPFEDLFQEKKKLIIIPDGILHYLPFDCLLTEKKPHSTFKDAPYLINKIQINIYPTATSMFYTNALPEKIDKGTIDYFSPVFNSKMKTYYQKLPISSKDTLFNQLAELRFSGRLPSELEKKININSFNGFEANKNNFLKFLNKKGIMHLATHTVFNNSDIMLSFIVFGLDSNNPNNPYLYLSEILCTTIKKKLIILSSCETGVGIFNKELGNMSLAQSFYLSGCPNLIFTLWPVDDKNTSTLFKDFYINITKKIPSDEALYLSKKQFLSTCNNNDANPINWAGYIYSGDAVIYNKSSESLLTILLLCFIVIFILSGRLIRKKMFRKFY